WVIVAAVAISVLTAAAQGFFFEIFLLCGAAVGYELAAWQYHRVAVWFLQFVSAAWIADAAGFLTIFFGCILLAGVAGRICRWMFKEAGLQWFDRVLGAAFGLVRGIAMVTVVVMGVAAFSPGSRMLAQSQLSGYFLILGRGASWLGPRELRTRLWQGIDRLQQLAADQPANAANKGQP
ncbi:MAG TPA: CvpA family protein, partial [Terriglobales bacterium]|nr:CvpA family protein [Terriglobales bacterium]